MHDVQAIYAERRQLLLRTRWQAMIPMLLPYPALLADMKRAGLSYKQQAERMGVGISTHNNWRQGAEPRASFSDLIVELHTEICGPELTAKRRAESVPRPSRHTSDNDRMGLHPPITGVRG